MATENSSSVGGELILPGSEVNPGSPPAISKLGDDLLVEILIRLPDPRSACRCKPLCKWWNSLISGPYFNRRFVSHHRSKNDDGDTPLLISSVHIEPIILSFLPVPEVGAETRFRVFDSFNDLVLCGFWPSRVRDYGMLRNLFVCNPFTKQWFALPLMPAEYWVVHFTTVARLVCEPRSSLELDLGDDRVFVYREYRFRVVCIYADERDWMSTKLDVFCFESREWTKEALVFRDPYYPINLSEVTSHNGKLFWRCFYNRQILVVDAFHLDRPPIRVEVPHEFTTMPFDFSFSQGALHAVQLEYSRTSRPLLTVWKQQDEDGRDHHSRVTWRKLYQVRLEEPSKSYDHDREYCCVACLHPNEPHIVFLKNQTSENCPIISCHDVRTGEESLFAEASYPWKAFQPRISVWPTQIPNYDMLRVAYDGSYSCWVQQNGSAAAKQLLSR